MKLLLHVTNILTQMTVLVESHQHRRTVSYKSRIQQSLSQIREDVRNISQQHQTILHVCQFRVLLLVRSYLYELENERKVSRKLTFEKLLVGSMENAHQRLNDRLLQRLSIVEIRCWDGNNSFTTEQQQGHNPFKMFTTKMATLQKQFSNTHQHIQLQIPGNFIRLYNSTSTSYNSRISLIMGSILSVIC